MYFVTGASVAMCINICIKLMNTNHASRRRSQTPMTCTQFPNCQLSSLPTLKIPKIKRQVLDAYRRHTSSIYIVSCPQDGR
jgi:hypothetical protein